MVTSPLGTSFTYNSHGMTTNYTLDLVVGLTQVLADGHHTYLNGLGRLAQQNMSTTEYFLGDALGSVRQLVAGNGMVTTAQDYTPYGETLASVSDGRTSAYGYTGEWPDAMGLVYLRSRFYAPGEGRFVTKDPSRVAKNRYSYVGANPIIRVDPTGLFSISNLNGPSLFALCFDLHSGTRGTNIIGVTAELAVEICRAAYSEDMWQKSDFNFSGGRPTSGNDLFGWYLFEYGKHELVFHANEPLTQELAKSLIVDKYVRYPYYLLGKDIPATRNGSVPIMEFGFRQQLECLDFSIKSIPITCVLGSFKYQVKTLLDGTIGIRIDNRTDLSSGTHFAGRHESGGYTGSVEGLIAQGEVSPYEPLITVLMRTDVISILQPLDRLKTGIWTGNFFYIGTHQLGGGNQKQTYIWKEPRDLCPSFEKYLSGQIGPSQRIEPWLDYLDYTQSVDW